MTSAVSQHGKFLHPSRIFTLFKWLVYALLAWNAFLFLQQDLAASAETFGDTISWKNVIEAYSAFIDTSSWLVLLLVFEFETAIIPDDKLKGGLKWLLLILKATCYFLIVYAFYGYLSKYLVITNLLPYSIADVCSLVGTEWNYIVDLDDYPPIDSTSCVALQGQALLQVSGLEIVGTAASVKSAIGLAIVDIINAGTWLIIVVLLQAEVWLQLKDMLTDRLMLIAKISKGFFYAILFVCAAYWGFNGTFLDFWDAFLWLVAFIFIELNIFQWHEEG